MPGILRADSHNDIRVSKIRRGDTDAIPASFSSVTANIKAASGGSALTGSSISLSLVSGKTDEYKGSFPNTVALTRGTEYDVFIVVTADSLVLTEAVRCVAV